MRAAQLGGIHGARGGRSGAGAGARKVMGAYGALVQRALTEVQSTAQLLLVKHRMLEPTPPSAEVLSSALGDGQLQRRVLRLRRVLQVAPLVVAVCDEDEGGDAEDADEDEGSTWTGDARDARGPGDESARAAVGRGACAPSPLGSPLSCWPAMQLGGSGGGGGSSTTGHGGHHGGRGGHGQFPEEASPWSGERAGARAAVVDASATPPGEQGLLACAKGAAGAAAVTPSRRAGIHVVMACAKFDRACAGRMGQVGARFVVFPPWVEHPIEQADGTSVLTIMATHAEALPW